PVELSIASVSIVLGTSDLDAGEPTLIGQVTGPGDEAAVPSVDLAPDPTTRPSLTSGAFSQIEVDHNGDGIADGTTTADEEGKFRYSLVGVPPADESQTVTVHVRTVEHGLSAGAEA